jgi:S-adenosylmethionine:tRNA ribosyltransferase-isomerase
MDVSLFDYPLPPGLIAQEPAARRDESRLLVYHRASERVGHHRFHELTDLVPADARFFRNNASVLKARLFGWRPGGGAVECLLLHPADEPMVWWCLLRPGKKVLRRGRFRLEGEFEAEVLEAGTEGAYRVAFRPARRDESVPALAERIGVMPLPPYIDRERDDVRRELDNERYQTVYADPARRRAVAAPTAGLHFTPELIARLESGGARFFDLFLQVGAGTFQPIQAADIREHRIHHEWYEIPAPVFGELHRSGPGPRIAVGTTSVRSVEDAFRRERDGRPLRSASGAAQAEADLYLYPPATFHAVDALVTNFHLPRSTLLCLVAAFLEPGGTGGIERLKALYAEAVAMKYRFYSYGDAMLIL